MSGRWPSNFVIIHNPGCEKIGVKKVRPTGGRGATNRNCEMMLGQMTNRDSTTGAVDSDGLETIDDWKCSENCPVVKLGEQSGEISHGNKRGGYIYDGKEYNVEGFVQKCKPKAPSNYADKGTAARFFFQADWSYERIEEEELWNGGMEDS